MQLDTFMTGKSSLYRYTLMLTVGLSAVVLLTLSWPRLRASLNYLPVDTAISNYWKTRQIDNAQLDGLIKKAEESIAIYNHYRYQAGLSELKILSGQDMSRSLWQRRQAMEDAIKAAENVVRHAPARPREWLRIARAKEFLAYPAEEIMPAFKMSILTGRVEPTLMLMRLELGLRQLPMMDDEAVRLLRDQALLTWANQKRPMQKRIESGHLNINQLRELLAESNPDVVREMDGGGEDNG